MTYPKQINVMAAKNTAYALKASVTRNAGTSMIQKRIGALILALFGMVAPAWAQGTAVPYTIPQYFDNNGDPLSGGRMCVFAAGTSTAATTYTTALLNVANANPIVLNSAGRPSSGASTVGIFLTPGTSYKFVLKDSTTTTCVPDTGVTIWSVDNVTSVPTSSVNVDVSGTAGEAITAGQVVYLSDGSGSKVAGSWYKGDADLSYAGALPQLGIAVNDIASGSSGAIRIAGRMDTLSGLTPGQTYYLSGTPGSVTLTAPVMARMIGQADSTTSMVLQPNPRSTPIMPRVPCGRVTALTNVPIPNTDVTAATSIYFTPYGGCSTISLYNGSNAWYAMSFNQVTVAVPATTATCYDVFGADSSGTLVIELQAWNSCTARHAAGTYASNLPTQDGVFVKSTNGTTIDATRLYLGSFRTTGVSGQTEDSVTKRFVFSYYNRVERRLLKNVATNSWTYTTATWRQANNATANQVEFMLGVAEDMMRLDVGAITQNDTGGAAVGNAIGLDSTTTPTTGTGRPAVVQIKTGSEIVNNVGNFETMPAIGYHFAALLERSEAVGNTTWYSQSSIFGLGEQTGIVGWVRQ